MGRAFVRRQWECERWVQVYPTRTGGFLDSASDDKFLSNPVAVEDVDCGVEDIMLDR
jgi:hypothetical protein